MRSDIVERFRIAPDGKTVVIPLGLQLDALLAMPSDVQGYRGELGIPAGDIVVGYVGRLVAIKDLPTLVHAFAGASRHTRNLWLVVVGDGPQRPEMENLARRLDVGSRVRFLGWVDDLPRVYATGDILCLHV